MPEAAIQLIGVTKSYGPIQVLKGIDEPITLGPLHAWLEPAVEPPGGGDLVGR